MEKFAIDLDKVLDEFEFNEDRAEQIASVPPTSDLPPPPPPPEPEPEPEPEAREKATGSINIHKTVSRSESKDSVNNFHPNESIADKKIPHKQSVDTEPTSLTIHNDISQRPLQKKQNETTKLQNSYDQKLKKSNVKPSVSNVFSSLNDYINAPTTSLEVRKEAKEEVTSGSESKEEQVVEENRKPLPPEYQNILLPVKLEPPLPEAGDLPQGVAGVRDTLETSSIIDRPEHVYENVYIGTDIPKPQESLPGSTRAKHTYENVDFDEVPQDNVYECIYIGNREKLPETTTELEIAAKKMAEIVFQTSKPRSAVGFGNIDDLSEEELNKYLEELEAEERRLRRDEEDANEAPIFETVTIGELPEVSEEELMEKAKKFPVIDYSKGAGTSGEGRKAVTEVEEERARGRRVKRTDEKMRKTSDNSEPVLENNKSSEGEGDEVLDPEPETQEVGNDSRPTQESENDFESPVENNGAHIGDEEEDPERPSRPQTLDIVSAVNMDEQPTIGSPGATPGGQEREEGEENVGEERPASPDASESSSMECGTVLGKQPPFWIPDSEAANCMLCDAKFTVIKRRHHCRACGKVLCSKCCGMKYRLEYQGNIDSRVCLPCYQLLVKESEDGGGDWQNATGSIGSPHGRQPNPNNPMEYCSTVPPLQQLAGGLPTPPTVMVPVGVLKREGSIKQRAEGQKSVMFSDGIRPGCDLTELDSSWDPKPPYRKPGSKRLPTPPGPSAAGSAKRQNLPPLDPETNSYIPKDPQALPPTVVIHKGQINYHEVPDLSKLYESLKNECEPPLMFAINRNLYAYVKITNLNCCVNKTCWNVTSRGLACVGQDEVILLVETLPDETQIPKDLLMHINQIYIEAIKGNTITELGVSMHQGGNLLGSREHAGFLFVRQTFQCLQKIVLPPAPFLVGLLVHRWETPWAKVFPLRLVLRLGAEYRYYPCPLVSVRFRDAVYFEIGHTIMKVLADFRNFAYTLPGVRGLSIHMQDRTTDVMFPKNRYDQVIRGLNNSNDHVLAYASNFSVTSDSHLVCIQASNGDESSYQTQAINIHNKPRKVTGASFIVINGALKSSMGLSAKSSIVEDGLMVQIMPEKMEALKAALKNMQDFSIGCGPQGAAEPDETVNIKWVDNDVQFNIGVRSPIDAKPMDGVPSIRVHNGTDYMGTSRFIRWTEVFIIKSDDHPNGVHDPVDINRLSESIARATCAALVKLLDLLATAGITKIAVRTTIHPDNVGYEAGSEGTRLPPIYMKSLDNELIQVLHKAAQSSQDTCTILELVFHVLNE